MSKNTTYREKDGAILVTDRRQLSRGAIVPNYVVDLYLPILGYEGIGVLTMLYRLANDNRVITNLHEYAYAGRIGFRKFNRILAQLEECGIAEVNKPQGADRLKHYHTEIVLLDAPTATPIQYTDEVKKRMISSWLVEGETGEEECQVTLPEVSPDTSTKCQVTLPKDVPSRDVPSVTYVANDAGSDNNDKRQAPPVVEQSTLPGLQNAVPRKEPRRPPDATSALPEGESANLNALYERLALFFSGASGLAVPDWGKNPGQARNWKRHLLEVARMVDLNLWATSYLIEASLQKLLADDCTVSGPHAIVKTARAIHAAWHRGELPQIGPDAPDREIHRVNQVRDYVLSLQPGERRTA